MLKKMLHKSSLWRLVTMTFLSLCTAPLVTCCSLADDLSARSAKFLTSCSFRAGDTVEKVKEFYKLTENPTVINPSGVLPGVLNLEGDLFNHLPKPESYQQYRLESLGVWIFFGTDGKIKSLRFNRPFKGAIHGVRIGDLESDLLKKFGKPKSTFDGGIDDDFFEIREEKKRKILSELPDPAPKAKISKAFIELETLLNSVPPTLKAMVFDPSDHSFLRLNIDRESKTVKVILTDSCGQ
jgi:hypothetical protein